MFKIEASDPLGGVLSYQWYKGTPPDTSTPVGINDPNLTIAVNVAGDFGNYYCAVSNGEATVDSEVAELFEKATMGYWPLDGNANDLSGNGLHGTLVNSPDTITGKVATALDFHDPNEYATLPAFDRPDFFTISAWVKTNAGGLRHIYTWGNDTGEELTAALFRINDGVLEYGEWDGGTYANLTAGSGLNDGQWHHVAVTFNSTAVELFIDGLSANSGTVDTLFSVASGVSLGNLAETDGFINSIQGALDDVKLINYPMTAKEIADIYVAVEGSVCLGNPQYDYNQNCIVDMADFAMFAAQWLSCNIYPDCVPFE